MISSRQPHARCLPHLRRDPHRRHLLHSKYYLHPPPRRLPHPHHWLFLMSLNALICYASLFCHRYPLYPHHCSHPRHLHHRWPFVWTFSYRRHPHHLNRNRQTFWHSSMNDVDSSKYVYRNGDVEVS